MSSNIKRLYHKKLKLGLTLTFILIISGFITMTWPIWMSYNKPVEIMKLISNTEPVFSLSPLLPYKHELITDLATNISKETTSLNLALTISNTNLNTSELAEELKLLSIYDTPIFLSMIPSDQITDDEYISTFLTIDSIIKDIQLDNIQLICYPQTKNIGIHTLTKYKKIAPTYIGVELHSSDDLKSLDKIYNTFSSSTKLVINDTIYLSYSDNTKDGVETVNYVYYDLAIKYPRITTIYTPYMTLSRNKWLKESNPQLLPSLDNRYITTYEHLISKPWITTKSNNVIETAPYQLLEEYDTLSGEEEIILSPDSKLIKQHKNRDKNISYLTYRFNTEQFKVQAYYPYALTIDTTTLPNGINRIKALVYNDKNEIILAPSIDITVTNNNVIPRAPRLKTSYPLGHQPIYTSDYIPILMYHTIADTVLPKDENSCVQTQIFDSQMKALIDNNYTPITFYDLENYLEGQSGLPEKPILITMDDGYLNNYTIAYPIYKKYNISATLFVSTFYMQEQNTQRHFGFAAAREMEQSGLIDIESHGYDHTPFTKLSVRDLKYHISLSKGILEKNLGARDVFTVACPQFRNTYLTRKTLASQNVIFQMTKLAKPGTGLKKSRLKRINVPNTMTPQQLISTLESLTR